MKSQQSSTTAEGMALVRAIESEKPEGQRLFNDPYARALVSGVSYALSKLFITTGLYERFAGDALTFILVRERYIDDFLKAQLQAGVEQVVFLGAGFDTRTYRIPEMNKVQVFEIDHPATQTEKLKRLKKTINPLPSNVTFVPVDFDTQTLAERLLASSYNEHLKTAFIWQGVTVYLTAQGVASTLDFIAHHSGAGSSVVFDYFYSETLQDTNRQDVKAMRRAAQITGEEYLFGIEDGTLEAFLSQRGFRDIHDATAEELTRRYLVEANAGKVIPNGFAIASAKTKKR